MVMLGGIELSEGEPDKLFLRPKARIFRTRARGGNRCCNEESRSNPLEISKSATIVHRTSRIMSSAILRNPFSRYIVVILGDAPFVAARLVGGCVSTRAFWTAPAERSDDGPFPQRCDSRAH